MTVTAEPTFLDTNILVYASVYASPLHMRRIAQWRIKGAIDSPNGSLWDLYEIDL